MFQLSYTSCQTDLKGRFRVKHNKTFPLLLLAVFHFQMPDDSFLQCKSNPYKDNLLIPMVVIDYMCNCSHTSIIATDLSQRTRKLGGKWEKLKEKLSFTLDMPVLTGKPVFAARTSFLGSHVAVSLCNFMIQETQPQGSIWLRIMSRPGKDGITSRGDCKTEHNPQLFNAPFLSLVGSKT